jgi:hypothetical protein
MSPSVITWAVLINEANRFLAGAVLSGADSISVFQAWQLGHLPSHLGLTPPQSEQTKTVFSFAMAAMVMHARIQSVRPVRDGYIALRIHRNWTLLEKL